MGSGFSGDKIPVDGLTKEQLDKLFIQFQAKIKSDYEVYTNKPFPSNYSGSRGLINAIARVLARFIYNQKDDNSVMLFDLKKIQKDARRVSKKVEKRDLVQSKKGIKTK